jgi:hypothetical protein
LHGRVGAAASGPFNCPNEPGDGSDGIDTMCTYVKTELQKKVSGLWLPITTVAGGGPTPTLNWFSINEECPGTSVQSGPFRTYFSQRVDDYVAPLKPSWVDDRWDAGSLLDCSIPKVNVQPPPT